MTGLSLFNLFGLNGQGKAGTKDALFQVDSGAKGNSLFNRIFGMVLGGVPGFLKKHPIPTSQPSGMILPGQIFGENGEAFSTDLSKLLTQAAYPNLKAVQGQGKTESQTGSGDQTVVVLPSGQAVSAQELARALSAENEEPKLLTVKNTNGENRSEKSGQTIVFLAVPVVVQENAQATDSKKQDALPTNKQTLPEQTGSQMLADHLLPTETPAETKQEVLVQTTDSHLTGNLPIEGQAAAPEQPEYAENTATDNLNEAKQPTGKQVKSAEPRVATLLTTTSTGEKQILTVVESAKASKGTAPIPAPAAKMDGNGTKQAGEALSSATILSEQSQPTDQEFLLIPLKMANKAASQREAFGQVLEEMPAKTPATTAAPGQGAFFRLAASGDNVPAVLVRVNRLYIEKSANSLQQTNRGTGQNAPIAVQEVVLQNGDTSTEQLKSLVTMADQLRNQTVALKEMQVSPTDQTQSTETQPTTEPTAAAAQKPSDVHRIPIAQAEKGSTDAPLSAETSRAADKMASPEGELQNAQRIKGTDFSQSQNRAGSAVGKAVLTAAGAIPQSEQAPKIPRDKETAAALSEKKNKNEGLPKQPILEKEEFSGEKQAVSVPREEEMKGRKITSRKETLFSAQPSEGKGKRKPRVERSAKASTTAEGEKSSGEPEMVSSRGRSTVKKEGQFRTGAKADTIFAPLEKKQNVRPKRETPIQNPNQNQGADARQVPTFTADPTPNRTVAQTLSENRIEPLKEQSKKRGKAAKTHSNGSLAGDIQKVAPETNPSFEKELSGPQSKVSLTGLVPEAEDEQLSPKASPEQVATKISTEATSGKASAKVNKTKAKEETALTTASQKSDSPEHLIQQRRDDFPDRTKLGKTSTENAVRPHRQDDFPQLTRATFDKLVKNTRLLVQNQGGQLHIQLKPDVLGGARLLVETLQNQISVKILVDKPETRHILEQHVQALHAAVAQQAGRVQEVQISIHAHSKCHAAKSGPKSGAGSAIGYFATK